MRITLFAAAAPLVLLSATLARAETAVSSRSTAVASSTVADGAADDISIANGVTLSPSSGTAVTLDSNNSVSNDGTISISNADGATGIAAAAGITGSITNSGSITLGDGYTASDSANDDDVAEAPFASGTGRYGIRTLGDLTGTITNSGSISVSGNESYGVFLGGTLNGALDSSGTVSLTGDNGAGIRTAAVTGDLTISGSVSASGQNSSAVVTTGSVGGALSVYSSLTSTGYSQTSRPTDSSDLKDIQSTAADLQQSAATLLIQGDVAGGVFIGAPPADTKDDSTEDLDGDGVEDGDEGTGSVTSYGSAAAIEIGAATPIAIGAFGTGDNAFGLIVRGSVGGYGVYDGFSATGIDLGTGGGGVTIAGGMRVTGSVTAQSYEADATAIRLRSGVVLPTLQNEGSITAVGESSAASSITALQIDAGATMTSLVNYGTLSASVTGNQASATAVVDRSGSITAVLNTGTISATTTAESTGDATTGDTVALDLSANTTGVTLRQALNGDDEPSITGDILLGSGSNTVLLESGTVTGALDLGSGPSSLVMITGGADYLGALSYSGSGLSLSILDGSLETTNPVVLQGQDLTIGANGVLTLAIDPAAGTASQLQLSGTASIAEGGVLGVRLLSAPTGQTTYRLIDAATLSVADPGSVEIATPYLFSATSYIDQAGGTIDVTLTRRSASELGLNRSESAALDPVYAALSEDSGTASVILNAADKSSFTRSYDQMLPDHSGDVFQVVSQISQAGGRAALEGRLPRGGYWDEGAAVWVQEFFIGTDQAKGDGEAYRAAGLGVAAGMEATSANTALGLSFTAATVDVDQLARPGDSNLSVSLLEWGLYWRADTGGVRADARVAAGYLSVKNRRTFSAVMDDDVVSRTALSAWNGYEFSGRLGLAYEAQLGAIYLRPAVHGDALMLREGDYAESGGGDGFDLVVENRSGHSASVTASLALGANLGGSFNWRPELELGWTQTLSADAGATTARFAYGGDSFTLIANTLEGGALIAKAGVTGGNGYINTSVQAAGEFAEDRTGASLRAAFKIPF